jgi:hypothetical protein
MVDKAQVVKKTPKPTEEKPITKIELKEKTKK